MTIVATLYKFAPLPDAAALRPALFDRCQAAGLKGTLLLAQEGINGTIAGTRAGLDAVLAWLRSDPRLADLQAQESIAPLPPFQRLKVKLKREIVTLRQESIATIQPEQKRGQAVTPEEWNALLADPDVTVIDTRNGFEVAIGTFDRAIDPGTREFRQFPEAAARLLEPSRDRRVAMFCTGGIRCEKASAYLLSQGFETVYQLEGGILNYLATIPEAESRWRGECFVFDERVALRSGDRPGTLEIGSYQLCQPCGQPVRRGDRHCGHCGAALPDVPCAIGLGGNVGDVAATFDRALARLAATPGVTVVARSRWYHTPPMGPPQPDYLNGCALLQTTLTPEDLLTVLQTIEQSEGRDRSIHWGPRRLDLDLLLWGDRGQTIIEVDRLTVPHPGLGDRAFVLVPLAEIAPDWLEPQRGQSIATLVNQVDCSAVVPLNQGQDGQVWVEPPTHLDLCLNVQQLPTTFNDV